MRSVHLLSMLLEVKKKRVAESLSLLTDPKHVVSVEHLYLD